MLFSTIGDAQVPGSAKPVSVTPSGSFGMTQAFTFQYSDSNGVGDIAKVANFINLSLTWAGSCGTYYDSSTNTIRLINETGDGWAGSAAMGTSVTLQNLYCSLDVGHSSVSASGNTLTLTVALAFTAFLRDTTESKTIYGWAQDGSGNASYWTSLGSWTVSDQSSMPSLASLQPPVTVGSENIYSVTYTDPNGYKDIGTIDLLFNSSNNWANSCGVEYVQATNSVQLTNDAGTGWVGTMVIGTTGTLSNSQCTLDVGQSSALISPNFITVSFAFTFKPALSGMLPFSMSKNSAGQSAGWNLNLSGCGNPRVGSVSPSSGTGFAQDFTAKFFQSSPSPTAGCSQGGPAIAYGAMIFNTSPSWAGSCGVYYDMSLSIVRLVNDAGTGWVRAVVADSIISMENSQCILYLQGGDTAGSPNGFGEWDLRASLSFKPVFAGSKNIYGWAMDAGGNASQYTALGTWNASSTPAAVPPQVKPLTPFFTQTIDWTTFSTGEAYTFDFSDVNGYNYMSTLTMLINSGPSRTGGCVIDYDTVSNSLSLVNDSGTGYVGTMVLGTTGTMQNSQCIIDVGQSKVANNFLDYFLAVPATFKSPFSNTGKSIYGSAIDMAGANSGLVNLGPPTDTFIKALSVTPNSGTGNTQTFSFKFSDGDGYGAISGVKVIFNSSLSFAQSCGIYYVPSTGVIELVNQAGDGWVGAMTIGATGTLHNNQCTLDVGNSSATASGSNLTLNLVLTFQSGPGFSGQQTIYGWTQNVTSSNTGWVNLGNWTVP